MMKRLVPRPLLTFTILVLWLMLASDISVGQVLLGTAIGLVIPIVTAPFWPERLRIVRPLVGIRLFLVLLYDIVVANLRVARLVLGPTDKLRSQFVEVPLDIDDRFVAVLLGSVVALTPGTVSIDIDRTRRALLVHALDLDDPDELVRLIKTRYEIPLKETFGC
jgi:multicomponent K+:H+ antiporter subunit E